MPDEPDSIFQDFCREQGIRPIHLSVDKVKDNVPLTYNQAVEAVQVREQLGTGRRCYDSGIGRHSIEKADKTNNEIILCRGNL